jgi:hypothetical protein
MEVGSYMKATGTTMGLNVSKTFGPRMFSFTPYAGLMFESSNMEFKYDYVISNDLVNPKYAVSNLILMVKTAIV